MKLLETILIQGGQCYHLEYHQKRLNRTFKQLFKDTKPLTLAKLITPPEDKQSYRCRFIYDKNSYSVEFIAYQPIYKTDYKLVEIDFDYPCKFLDRTLIDQAKGVLQEHEEAVFIKDGFITDTTIANIACYINGSWLTPAKPLLEGTTRARLLDEKKLIPADIRVEDFKKAEKIAFFNALTNFYEVKNHPS